MSLDVSALARFGFTTARQLVPAAFVAATVRLGATPGAYNSATDTQAVTWAVEQSANVFGYDDDEERKNLPATAKQKSFLVDPNEFPAGTVFDESGAVVIGSDTWQIYKVETAPGGAIVTLHCHR